jgi:hypothetical protein
LLFGVVVNFERCHGIVDGHVGDGMVWLRLINLDCLYWV